MEHIPKEKKRAKNRRACPLPGDECQLPVHSSAGEPRREIIGDRRLVGGLRRGRSDPQFSRFLHRRSRLHAAVHRVQGGGGRRPQADWSVPQMAEVAHTSPRHLTRLFLEHAGIAPLQCLRRIRLATAEAALRSGQNVTQAALMAGFSSDTQLRRAWHQFGRGGTPSQGSARNH